MKKIIELSKLEGNRGQIAGVPVNPRKITPRNFDKLKNSIKRDPELLKYRGLLVAPHGDKFVVIGGNQRLEALRALGFTETTCEIMDDLEQIPEEDRAEVLRHRILADNAGFGEDDDELIEEFFSDIKGDYETLSDDDLDQEPEDEDEILEVKTPELEEDPKSELGKIYQLGEHRLMCGDSTSESDVKKLMGGGTGTYDPHRPTVRRLLQLRHSRLNSERRNRRLGALRIFIQSIKQRIRNQQGEVCVLCVARTRNRARVLQSRRKRRLYNQATDNLEQRKPHAWTSDLPLEARTLLLGI